MADPKRVFWLGGALGAVVAWGFSSADVYAHRGALDPASSVLIVVGALLVAIPRIENLRAKFPLGGREGVEVSINDYERVVKAADEASALAAGAGDTAEEAAKLYESWLRELDALFDGLERVPFDRGAYVRAVFRFINTRLEDISTWVGAESEEVRAALWWWSDADGGARIVAAPRIGDAETLGYVFRPGVGILGRVLIDGEPENLSDASLDIAWQRIAKSAPRYRGLLCLPIVVRGRVAGVLTVDRARPESFADDSIRFARQIAQLIKLAALHTTARGNVFSLPLPQDEVRARPPPDSP